MNIKHLLQQLQEKSISPQQAMQQLKGISLSEDSMKEITEVMKKYVHSNIKKNSAEASSVKQTVQPVQKSEAVPPTGSATKQGRIAIIGMAGKYPGAEDMDRYWDLLVHGLDGISEIPKWRCDVDRLYDAEKQKEGHIYTKKMGAIKDVDKFDPVFFEIAPSEADLMDPQQRVFLEIGYKAFEDAGYCRDNLNNTNCGVYLGMSHAGYDKNFGENDKKSLVGSSSAVAAARLSYFLNLKGPALTVDTACSSSLVCADIAVQALLNGDIDLALAGGSSIYLDENAFIGMCEAGMLSEEGVSRPFDSNADGIVVSDGVGAVVLKRFEDALKDHDNIYGVIIAAGMNQDGKTNGITAPGLESQKTLIRDIYQQNEIDANDISYIEMHGTGTKLGDPIELEAIGSVYKQTVKKLQSCPIGSVKSNIGHTSAASGMAGLQKILLCMQHKTLVPTINLKKKNERFDFEHSPFYVNQKVKEWTTENGKPRRAALSSFGFSGTNAHMVVEEYNAPDKVIPGAISNKKVNVFLLSAKTKQSLRRYVCDIIEFLQDDEKKVDFTSFLYTYQCRREHFKERIAIVTDSREDLIEKLNQYLEDQNNNPKIYKGTADRNKFWIQAFDASELKQKSRDEIIRSWLEGKRVEWKTLYGDEIPYVISAPTYPFEKESHWIAKKNSQTIYTQQAIHPLLQKNISRLDCQEFLTVFTAKEQIVAEHMINGKPVLPGTATLEMALAAGGQSWRGIIREIRDVVWLKPIEIDEGTNIITSLTVGEMSAVDYNIRRVAANGKESEVCTRGSLFFDTTDSKRECGKFDYKSVLAKCSQKIDGKEIYQNNNSQISYGKHYQTIKNISYCENEAVAVVESAQGEGAELCKLDPFLLDGVLQVISVFIYGDKNNYTAIPFSIKTLKLYGELTKKVIVYVQRINKNSNFASFNFVVMDDNGLIIMEIEDFSVKNLLKKNETYAPAVTEKESSDSICKAEQSDAYLIEKAEDIIKTALSEKIKISIERLDSEENFEAYGIDSIISVDIARELGKTFGKLSGTLMFEYQTISSLAEYLLKEKREILKQLAEKQGKNKTAESLDCLPINIKKTGNEHTKLEIIKSKHETKNFDIAVIGMSGQYPMAKDLEQFWENLKKGLDCIIEIPKERWDNEKYYDKEKGKLGKTNSKWGGFLEDAYCFDSLFFNMSPSEAEFTDPQIRVFLETAWHTIEDAGYTREALGHHKVGVYAGAMYALYHLVETQMKGEKVAGLTSFSMIANRISYFMNLHGPSIALDTMCSSSLTAVHLACQAIRNGEIDMALAGGVNIVTHPRKYIQLSQNNFMSSDGRCRSFGEGGDGYVPGEGSGCMLLKSLEAAKKDHDHIYAVIKASSINAGGKAVGFTVPNMEAQAELILDSLKQANINPRTIGYYEAHGTGTSLGDPIEINGMTKAYRAYTMERGFCPVGSVKSNIGHLESAAGMASLMKVILQMQNRQLVPSIHTEQLNSNINFEETPFYVQRKLEEWKPLVQSENGVQITYPRRAAVSAFGAGGSNAHIIVEEYNEKSVREDEKSTRLFVLSAKKPVILEEYVQKIINWLEKTQERWSDIIYTFQIGREAMEERLAIVADSKEQLLKILKEYIKTKKVNELLFRGNVLDSTEKKADNAEIEKCIKSKAWTKLAQYWLKGNTVDWEQLYEQENVYKISAPVYPFARVYHFLKRPGEAYDDTPDFDSQMILHPMLHMNLSNRKEWLFTSVFSGNESFLKDHIVNHEKVLPAAAYLEMVTFATKHVFGDWHADNYGVCIQNIVWLKPYVFSDNTKSLSLSMKVHDEEKFSFEVFSQTADEKQLHCRGLAGVIKNDSADRGYDINKALSRCCENEITGSECYKIFHALGLDYGEGQKCIKSIHLGKGEVTAELEISRQCANYTEEYTLHPGFVDSAFQSTIGLRAEESAEEGQKAALPFAIEQMAVYGPCTSKMWAHISYTEEQRESSSLRNVDIVLVNDNKQVSCKMQKVSFRAMKGEPGSAVPALNKNGLMLTTAWKQENEHLGEKDKVNRRTIVFTCNLPLDGIENESRYIPIQCQGDTIAEQYQTAAIQLFKTAKAELEKYKDEKLSFVLFIGYTKETQSFLGLYSLMKTIQTEYSKVICRTIGVLKDNANINIEELLQRELKNERADLVSFEGGKRFVYCLEETASEEKAFAWKQNGVYLISGGTGALGLLTAWDIIKSASNAKCILLGRSDPKEDAARAIKEMNKETQRVSFVKADVTVLSRLREAVQEILSIWGHIDGVIHCSGVISDRMMRFKDTEEFKKVLAPKVFGTYNLDEATKECKLDVFVLYSSLASVIGNMGQCDYACANGFMDFFADDRNNKASKGQRYGMTYTVNWPLWKHGGMHVDEDTKNAAEEAVGLTVLSNESGIKLLHTILQNGKSHAVPLPGDTKKLREAFLPSNRDNHAELKNAEKSFKAKTTDETLSKCILKTCIDILVDNMRLNEEDIDERVPFEDYGIDSVRIISITDELEKAYGVLPKTLLYEYKNLRELAEYILEHKPNEAAALYHTELPEETKEVSALTLPVKEKKKEVFEFVNINQIKSSDENQSDAGSRCEDIAIIGVSGRYPLADNLMEFWENLKNGEDCITEIPKSRWDYEPYYTTHKGEYGKMDTKWGGFIKNAELFDSLFFKISPAEADFMDPQLRIFIQTAWHTLEDAGYTPESLKDETVGVFAGVMYSSYEQYSANIEGVSIPFGVYHASVPNRVSYLMDFKGPSIAVDTVCSSSLTALHLACESIKRGESSVALVGGVNLTLHPNKMIVLSQNKFMSAEGKCRSFGEGGDGYVPGEGCGAVLIKPLKKAIEDKDHIYAVIKGTAVSGSGRTNGFRVPNPVAQARVIQDAYKNAGVSPETITYIEAHGTGTKLGDPVEVEGLNRVFGENTKETGVISIGSVKSNIGHLEAAAGMAAITKVLLQMKYKKLVPSIHSKELNRLIDFKHSPFYVQQTYEPWKRKTVTEEHIQKEIPLRAGISAFGAGGCNAHVVLEEYQDDGNCPKNEQKPQLIVLSAKNEERLREYVRQMSAYLETMKHEQLHKRENDGILRILLKIISEITQLPASLDIKDMTYEELGFDEYMLSSFNEALENQIRFSVNEALFHQYQTPRQLADYIADCQKSNEITTVLSDISLKDIAYTLQCGRIEQEERLAVVARDTEELLSAFRDYLNHNNTRANLFTGSVNGKNSDFNCLMKLMKDPVILEKLYHEENLEQLAELWVHGVSIPWSKVFDNHGKRRVSLPGYPFEPEKHWLTGYDDGSVTACNESLLKSQKVQWIHPLVQKNSSTLYGMEFTSVLSQNELFLNDHMVQKNKTLPAAAYFEMVQQASRYLYQKQKDYNYSVILENVTLQNPFVVLGEEQAYKIAFDTLKENRLKFNVKGTEENAVTYCSGKVNLDITASKTTADIKKFEAKTADTVCTKEEFYSLFHTAGIDYGRSHQCVERIYKDPDTVIARLEEKVGYSSEYDYHLGMIDSALQLAMAYFLPADAFSGENNEETSGMQTKVPVSFGKIELIRPSAKTMWAVVTLAAKPGHAGLTRLNIVMYDEMGNESVRFSDIAYAQYRDRTKLNGKASVNPADSKGKAIENTLFLVPQWSKKAKETAEVSAEHWITVFCGNNHINTDAINALGIEDIYEIESGQGAESDAYIECADKLLNYTKQLIKKYKNNVFVQLIVETNEKRPAFYGLSAMMKTLAQEYPRFLCQTIDVDYMPEGNELYNLLKTGRENAASDSIRLCDNEITYGNLSAVNVTEENETPWKNDGVYILFGGTGELGWTLAKEIADTAVNTHIVMSARSEFSEETDNRMKKLRNNGTDVEYYKADVTQSADVETLIAEVMKKYGRINGIVFLSGIIRDRFIIQKTSEEFKTVLSTKVLGICNVDRATKQIPMDFLIIYSSLSGVIGNAGQCDYAAANAYLDAYAEHREALRKSGKRYGKTISFNWPLCNQGGMGNDDKLAEMLKQSLGIVPMSKNIMMKSLNAGVKSGYAQMIPLEGDCDKIALVLLNNQPKQQKKSDKPAESVSFEELTGRFEHYIKHIVSPIIRLDTAKIDAYVKLEDYGIDSVVIMRLTERLEEKFGELTKSLFFENQTIHELSEYFCREHNERVKELLSVKEPAEKALPCNINAAANNAAALPYVRPENTINKSKLYAEDLNEKDEIAIIGIAGVYPQADNLDEFWSNLLNGRDCITEIPKNRWDCEKYYDENVGIKNKTNAKWGGFLKSPEYFDPLFFNISPKEAAALDPQERIFLQCVYHAIEDAGYTRDTLAEDTAYGLKNNVGVFVGVMYEEYQLYAAMQQAAGNMITLGASEASIANRVSYFCNFHGPSMALDSMCSSSLVTIHLACKSILDGECEAAVAGGVNLSIHPNKFFMLGQNGFAAKDGRCRSFGKGGTGYTPGEGVGALILKRKSKAVADGDNIYGIIKGSSVNHGGKVNGYSVPNPHAQSAVILQAMSRANLEPDDIDYIEAHGTGTALGDPIEISALDKVFGKRTKKLDIGSVKSNIGHCEGAAGIAAVSKVLLQMNHKILVPSIHSEELNPNINFDKSKFEVVRSKKTWTKENGMPLRAGVSAFGAGGTNAHIILESYDAAEKTESCQEHPLMFIFSARKEEQLNQIVKNMIRWMKNRNITFSDLRNIAYTLQVGREAMDERVGFIASNVHELLSKMTDFLKGEGDFCRGKVNEAASSLKKLYEEKETKTVWMNWYESGKYFNILELWVQGVPVPWKDYITEGTTRRISIPGYPFEEVRCWGIDEQNKGEASLNQYQTTDENLCQSAEDTDNNPEQLSDLKEETTLKEQIVDLIRNFLANELAIPLEEIDIYKSFEEYGVGSLTGIKMVDEITEHFDIEISSIEIYDYTSINSFAEFVEEEINKKRPIVRKAEEKTHSEKDSRMPQASFKNENPSEEKADFKHMNTESNKLDMLLKEVYQGGMEVEDAKRLLSQE